MQRFFKGNYRNKRWPLDKRGTAAIEFGLVIPLLITLLLCCAEIGFFIQQKMTVNTAVEAGISAATKRGFDSKQITESVLHSTTMLGLEATPAPALFCGCVRKGVVTQTACDVKCSGNLVPGHYVKISAKLKPQTIMPSSFLPLPKVISIQATTRLN
jgi:Flp pilus assembly protein TadG